LKSGPNIPIYYKSWPHWTWSTRITKVS